MMEEKVFRDPTKFCQVTSHNSAEYSPLLKDNMKNKKTKHEERVVVKDLLFSIRHTPRAYAIAANQRGWEDSPIFVCRQDPTKLSKLPPTHELATVLNDLSTITALREDIHVFKDPRIEIVQGSKKYISRESCLSHEGLEYTTERYDRIKLYAKMLDMQAYRANKNNLLWREIVFELEGLGAQIIQHEVDHLYGTGIWDFSLNYVHASS